MYNVEIGLHGKLSSSGNDGVQIKLVKNDRSLVSNPNDFFRVYDGEKGLMIQLINAVDRDVSGAAWHAKCESVDKHDVAKINIAGQDRE